MRTDSNITLVIPDVEVIKEALRHAQANHVPGEIVAVNRPASDRPQNANVQVAGSRRHSPIQGL